jgi:hypothetical protein
MPKQKRWSIKRELDRAIGNLLTAHVHLASVGVELEIDHPDLNQQLHDIDAGIEMLIHLIDTFRDLI